MVNNKVILIGRMTRDAKIMETKGEGSSKMATFTLAVDKIKRKQEQTEGKKTDANSNAYFIRCISFDRAATFLEQYGKQGVKFAVEGHLSTGSYEKDGIKFYTTDVVVENIQFCESKNHGEKSGEQFMEIPEEMIEEMPFK